MKKIALYIALSGIISVLSDLRAQTSEIDSLENLLKSAQKEDSVRVNLLNETAYRLRKIDLNKTLEYAEAAGELADRINFVQGKAESLRIRGIYYYYISDYPMALEYYKKSSLMSEEHGDKNGIAKCLNNIGNVYRLQGNYPQALEYFQNSLKIAEEIDDIQQISSCLGNIGLIYWKQENYSEALGYYERSLKIFEELGYKKGISNALNNIGILYYYQTNYSKSLEYFKRSLKIDEELEDKSGMSYSLNNIGEINMHLGNYSQSLEYHEKSLSLRQELGDKTGICSSYKNIGSVYLKTNDYAKALNYTSRSLEIANENKLLDKQKEIYKQLSEIYANTQNYKNAYENYVKFKTFNDSIFNEENIKKITGLEYQYEFEKEKQAIELEQQKKDALQDEETKRQKIIRNSFIAGFILMLILVLVVLRSVIQKRKANKVLSIQKNKTEEKNKLLKQLNSTQNRLMSIISHDFKAPISAFYSITNSLKTKFDKIDRKEIDNYFNRMLNSSIALKLQLDNMLNWAINQSREISVSKSMYNLSVLSYKVVLILQEFANEKSVIIKNNISDDCEIETDGRLLSIVLNNLIANAVKFSSPNSTVNISTIKKNDNLVLSVKDEGIGMSEIDTQNLFTGTGISSGEKNSGTGLGLIVSKDIVNKLGGKIWAKSKLDAGTEVFIELVR